MRFCGTENPYGYKEIEAFRIVRPPVNRARAVTHLEIVSFPNNFGGITLRLRHGLHRNHQTRTLVRAFEL
jgi:hypothetical protein